MKNLLIAFGIFISLEAMADLEHREGQGTIPSSKELGVSRACFREIDNLGCGHPLEDQEYFNTCLADQKTTLSSNCQIFFEKLYGSKSK